MKLKINCYAKKRQSAESSHTLKLVIKDRNYNTLLSEEVTVNTQIPETQIPNIYEF